jgi:hypothetical protein
MRLGIHGWRLSGQRTGVARYPLNVIRHWSEELTASRFAAITLIRRRPIDSIAAALPRTIHVKVLASDLPMLVWRTCSSPRHREMTCCSARRFPRFFPRHR